MTRRLFSEISPTTYKISQEKEIMKRKIKNLFDKEIFATTKSPSPLPALIKSHQSTIRRKLAGVDQILQNNKATNLAIATKLITETLIQPDETFSFWHLVGRTSKQKGYLDGLTIANGQSQKSIGGGMCQFTNLLHWLVLHTDLEIVEHHHHDGYDLFPDDNRIVPFGTGTSIEYNYLDYRFKNNSPHTYQLIIYITDEHLCGEIRRTTPLDFDIEIYEAESYFFQQDTTMYRHNKIHRKITDKQTGTLLSDDLIIENTAKTMYDWSYIPKEKIRRS